MQLLLFYSWLLVTSLTSLFTNTQPEKTKNTKVAKPITTIAFGSCNQEDAPQPLWADILLHKPQLWVWLGGNVKSDAEDLGLLQRKYEQQLAEPGYHALRNSASVIGTWSERNYGSIEARKDFAHKVESQNLFWNFMGMSEDNPLRSQEGVYSATTYGPKGKQVKVILLDTRYHCTALPDTNNSKSKDKSDLLGEAQWKWLAKELRSNSAQLTIIGTSAQVLPEEYAFENWSSYPKSRTRLLKLISKANIKGLVLLSGGTDMAEISKLDLEGNASPVYEITSSGLNTSINPNTVGRNQYRVGNFIAKRNFGLIQIDWEKREALFQVQGDRNTTYLSQAILF